MQLKACRIESVPLVVAVTIITIIIIISWLLIHTVTLSSEFEPGLS